MKKIFWDEGHGGKDPGAVANGLQEAKLNVAIVKHAMDYLKANYSGFEQKSTRNLKDIAVDLSKRDNIANQWGADLIISIHINAGGGRGFESFIFNGQVDAATISLQNVLHNEILLAMRKIDGSITDRGKKRANFSILRESKCPSVLTENLFIDSADHRNLKNEAFIKAIGEAHARGVAIYLGLPKKAKTDPKEGVLEGVYHVQVFSGSKTGAEKVLNDLKRAGYKDAFIKKG